MKRPSNKDSRLEDDDMASLFAEQNIKVPDDLKLSVFEQAQRQLNINATESTDFTESDDHSTPGSGLPDNIIPIERTQHHRFHSRSRWFAVAATGLIAVAVTPVLLNTPDSSLNSGGVATYDVDPTAPGAKAESAALADTVTTAQPSALIEPVEVSKAIDESDATVSVAPATASMDAEQTINTDQSMESRAALSSMRTMRQEASDSEYGGAAGDSDSDVSSSSLVAYRQNANRWIGEIRRLIKDKEATRAQSEYRLFEKQHPDLARNFKPDFQPDEK